MTSPLEYVIVSPMTCLTNSNSSYLSGTGASAPGAGGASPGRPPRAAASIRAIAGSIVVGMRGFKEGRMWKTRKIGFCLVLRNRADAKLVLKHTGPSPRSQNVQLLTLHLRNSTAERQPTASF
jgi:hypothetical protein